MSQEHEFEKYLDGKTDLSKLYAELPRVDLPKHLDAAILAEAHRAVNARPGAKPKRRWTIPLGMVATLFVAVMIGLQLPHILKDAAQPQQPKEERMAALMDKNTAEPSSPAPIEAMKSQLTGQILEKSKPAVTRGKPVSVAAEAEKPVQEYAPALAAPVVALPAPAIAAKRLEVRERADVDSGAAFSKEKKANGHVEGYVSDAPEQRAPAAARVAAPHPVQMERSLMQSIKDEVNEENLPPEDWLNRIKRLKQEGKLEEAKKDLAAFKKRYPDYVLPKDLEVR